MSEHLSIQNPQDIEAHVHRLGAVAHQAIIVGSAAVHIALDGAFRAPHDIDLAVPEGAFRELRKTHPDWHETTLPDGGPRLQGDGFDIGIGWGQDTQEKLGERTRKTTQGLLVAGLPAVYAWKDRRDLDEDREDLAIIRERLHGEDSRPLAAEMLSHEIEFARNCLPEHLRDDPDGRMAILLAANGLHIVRTVYGDITRGHVNRIVGETEKLEYGAIATYHEGGRHTPDGMRWLMRHYSTVNTAGHAAGRKPTFSKWDFFDGLIAYAYHDAIFGNGRKSSNPTRYDELCSGQLVRSHATAQGYTRRNAPTRLHNGVHGTTFYEATGAQIGASDSNPFIRSICGVDGQGMSEPNEVVRAYDLAAEYTTSGRPDRERTVGRVLNEHGLRVHTTRQLLKFADMYPEDRPSADGQTVREAIMYELRRDVPFIGEIFTYPEGWTGENKALRQAHAAELAKHILLIEQGESMLACYELAHEHADAMREQFNLKDTVENAENRP